jgi:hypothetical protein
MDQVAGVDVRFGDVPGLGDLVKAHPRVERSQPHSPYALEFTQSGRNRRITIGCKPQLQLGIVEIVDNNPLICADEVWLPRPSSTLVLLAAMPWVRAGLLRSIRSVEIESPTEKPEVLQCLNAIGVDGEIEVIPRTHCLQEVLEVSVLMTMKLGLRSDEVEEVFNSIYGNSFFVRSFSDRDRTNQVHNTAIAGYTWNLVETQGVQEIAVIIAADRNGKCGASQIVHTMNVMAGYEESLGIDSSLRR